MVEPETELPFVTEALAAQSRLRALEHPALVVVVEAVVEGLFHHAPLEDGVEVAASEHRRLLVWEAAVPELLWEPGACRQIASAQAA